VDLSVDFLNVSGRTALAQALFRRWTTDRGTLIDDPNYGTNLSDYINDDLGPGDVAKIRAAAESEALKDERVLDITSIGELTQEGVLNLTFTIVDAAGPFTLTVAVSDVTVDLLRVD
jgi:phage baseplate assembly protein W